MQGFMLKIIVKLTLWLGGAICSSADRMTDLIIVLPLGVLPFLP